VSIVTGVRGAGVAAVAWYDDTPDEIGSLGRLVFAGVAAVAKYGDGPAGLTSTDTVGGG
jgi:hypothetical protein